MMCEHMRKGAFGPLCEQLDGKRCCYRNTVCEAERVRRIEEASQDRELNGAARYETLRLLTPDQFAKLFRMNIMTGEHFDALVDKIAKGELEL